MSDYAKEEEIKSFSCCKLLCVLEAQPSVQENYLSSQITCHEILKVYRNFCCSVGQTIYNLERKVPDYVCTIK